MGTTEFLSIVVFLTITYSINPIENSPASEINERNSPPKLITNFIPASMQILHHCIESIQYEPVIPSTTTTARPITTTAAALQHPTTFHKPGNYGPSQPPPIPMTTVASSIPNATNQEQTTKPNMETTEILLWNDKQFFEWFLQSKYKQIELENEYNFQLLDPLPYRLRHDIESERYELPALLDKDNVNEFRKTYDDKYRDSEVDLHQTNILDNTESVGNRISSSGSGNTGGKGKKRVPPTKPYIHMLMLYDLLKREAKKYMFNLYEGYSVQILSELYQFSVDNAQQQLLFVLSRMLEEKNIDKADVVSRTKAMITELENPNSVITKTLIYVPPVIFWS